MYAEALSAEQASAVTPTVVASMDLLRTVIDASLDYSEGLTAPAPICSFEVGKVAVVQTQRERGQGERTLGQINDHRSSA